MKVLDWTKPSIADLSDIRNWLITEAGTSIAVRVLEQIRQQAEQLETFAALGPAVAATRRKWRVHGTNYVIVYRITSTSIDVLRIHHVRQNWKSRR
jgi:toxin ParE1/3/4